MTRSAEKVADQDPSLFPKQDGAGAVMIVGKDGGVNVVLRINALSMEDTAKLGTGGVYLQIAGTLGKSIAGAIAASAKSKDSDVCVYLDDAARKDLVEQLARFDTILDLHTLMAQQNAAKGQRAIVREVKG